MISVASQMCRLAGRHATTAALVILACLFLSACARLLPSALPPDEAADQLVARLKQTNFDIEGFKCLGKMTLTVPDQPVRSFRAVIAGRLHKRLRIDIFAPFGALAGTFASDGWNIFLVMPSSRKYYKMYYGRGSLRYFIQIDVTVGDLLELMLGRIPMDDQGIARWMPSEMEIPERLEFLDSRGRSRQRIFLDENLHPQRSEWLDRHQQVTHTVTLIGQQLIDGYRLPEKIELTGPKGAQLTLVLERYEANAPLDRRLFVPPNPWS